MKVGVETPKITVAIRKRPLNKKEIGKGETDIVTVNPDSSVVVSEYKQKVDLTKYIEQTTFNFDYAFDEYSTNEQIYDLSIRPLIESAFLGAKISCFAYGQTGSGKTFTMKGDLSKDAPGLYFLGANQIFNTLKQEKYGHLKVNVTFYEIYCGKLYDLLNNRNQLKIREDKNQNINVIGMEEKLITSAEEFIQIIEFGSNFRVTSQNATNNDSSRSHAILQITLKEGKKVFTKISFIDLAGNERGADHMDQNKQTRIDGAEINKSLLSLKECIRALDQGKSHTPFRGSKLTMVLKDSFVGFCKTIMIGNVSPNVSSSENTMNTLRYADRVKELKKANDGTSSVYSKEDSLAKELMLPRNNKNCIRVTIDNDDDQQDIMIKMEQAKRMKERESQQNSNKMDIESPMPQLAPQPRKTRKTQDIYTDTKINHHNLDKQRRSHQTKFEHNRENRRVGGQSIQNNYPNIVHKPSFQPNSMQKQINISFNNASTRPNTGVSLNHSQSNGSIAINSSALIQKPNGINQIGSSMTYSQNFSNVGGHNVYRDSGNPRSTDKMDNQCGSDTPNQENHYYFKNVKIVGPRRVESTNQVYNNSNSNNMSNQISEYGLRENQSNNLFEPKLFDQRHFSQFPGSSASVSHRGLKFQQSQHSHNLDQLQLQRNHSALVRELNHEYQSFVTEHTELVKEEANILKREMQMVQEISPQPQPLTYISIVENCIDQKLQLLTTLRSKVSFLRDRMQQAEQMHQKIRVINQSGFGDEQLLEGLPGDQIMGRLF